MRISDWSSDVCSSDLVAFEDGPYLDENVEAAATLKASATTGSGITITASGHAPFKEGDVGRPVRLRPTGEPGWAVITEFVSPEQVKVDVKRPFANVNAPANRPLGPGTETRRGRKAGFSTLRA